MHAYIDGDIIKYRCAFAAEKTEYLVEYSDGLFAHYPTHALAMQSVTTNDDKLWSRKVVKPLEFALQAAKTTMEALLQRYGTYNVYLSGPTNFRTDVAVTKPYKGNRDRTKDPIYKEQVGEYLIREYGATVSDGVEADDLIGIALSGNPEGCAVTTDKDLDQIPGWHYNWVSGKSYRVSRKQADYSLYTQLLTGDATDNIPGLFGVGPARAREVLDGATSSLDLSRRVWNEYRNSCDGYERAKAYFIEQLKLLYVQRKGILDAVMYLPTGFTFE